MTAGRKRSNCPARRDQEDEAQGQLRLSEAKRINRVCPQVLSERKPPVPLAQYDLCLRGGYKAASLAGWMGSTGWVLERWPHWRPCSKDTKLTASGSSWIKVPLRLCLGGCAPPVNGRSKMLSVAANFQPVICCGSKINMAGNIYILRSWYCGGSVIWLHFLWHFMLHCITLKY